jgi:hypothetical protein
LERVMLSLESINLIFSSRVLSMETSMISLRSVISQTEATVTTVFQTNPKTL